jgi:hypothetical protein
MYTIRVGNDYFKATPAEIVVKTQEDNLQALGIRH